MTSHHILDSIADGRAIDHLISSNDIVGRAYDFAQKAHGAIDHRRKYSGDPYIIHPKEVGAIPHFYLPADYKGRFDIIAAAFLHDTVEDTPVTARDIYREFGQNIGRLVEEVTDVSKPEDGNRKTRKEIDRQHIAQASERGKTLKTADLISNLYDIVHHDKNFAVVYLREAKLAAEILTEAYPPLLAKLNEAIDHAMAELGDAA